MHNSLFIQIVATELGFTKYAISPKITRTEAEKREIYERLFTTLQGLTRSQIKELFLADEQKRLLQYVRGEFLAPSIASHALAIENEALTLSCEEKVRHVAEALNPVELEGSIYTFDDLNYELKRTKVKAAAELLRRLFLFEDKEIITTLISDIENFQKQHHYISGEDGHSPFPKDNYYGSFTEMLQHGLGLSVDEASDLKQFLHAGFHPLREAHLLIAKLRGIRGFLKSDDLSESSKERLKEVVTLFFAAVPADKRQLILNTYDEVLSGYRLTPDLDIRHLPNSPEKKQLLALLKGRKETIYDSVTDEDALGLSPEEIIKKYNLASEPTLNTTP